MVDLLLVRRLPPYHANTGKRLVKSPKVYIRDSGVLFALLNLGSRESVLGHPIVGPGWEGFVLENLLSATPEEMHASFYRTAAGAEIDLLLEMQGDELWAIEIKRSLSPRLERGFHHAREDLKPARSFVVYAGTERYPVSRQVEAIGVNEMAAMLASL
jgi:predicted AAA+ superfamily ATPase